MCVCVCVHVSLRRQARRKEKLARENKVNEAWRRLPSSVLGRSSLASSFTGTTTPGARTENNSLRGVWWLVEEQSGCKRILCVYLVWLWLLTKTTLNSRGLQSSPCVFEQTLTRRIHLHFPESSWISLDYKRPVGWGARRASCTQHYNIKVHNYQNHNGFLCALTDYHWVNGK